MFLLGTHSGTEVFQYESIPCVFLIKMVAGILISCNLIPYLKDLKYKTLTIFVTVEVHSCFVNYITA